MPDNVAIAQAHEQQRQAQVALRAQFLTQFLATWGILNWGALDATFPAWVRSVKALIRPFRQRSADMAVQHYIEHRRLALPRSTTPAPSIEFRHAADDLTTRSAAFDPFTFDGLTAADIARGHRLRQPEPKRPVIDWAEFDKRVERSLLVTGPSNLKRRAARHETEMQAKPAALVQASGAASRQVLTGGREATLTLVEADTEALGWARLTDSDPCAFCALMASRGPSYLSEASASFKPHDGCACIAVAVFSRSERWPGKAAEYRRLYNQAARGYSGQDAINAFRRSHDARRREAVRQGVLSA